MKSIQDHLPIPAFWKVVSNTDELKVSRLIVMHIYIIELDLQDYS
jgi:hypothetical protein